MTNVLPFTAPQHPADSRDPEWSGVVVTMNATRAVYTVRQVADMLSISLGGTYQLCRDGEIPALKLGNRWVIPKRRFHVWLDNLPDAEPTDIDPADRGRRF